MGNESIFLFCAKCLARITVCMMMLFSTFYLSCKGKYETTCNKTNERACFVEFSQMLDGEKYCFCVTRSMQGEEYLYDSVFYCKQKDKSIHGAFAISSEIAADETTQNWHFEDINFDGKADFCFYSVRGIANMIGQYWLFNTNGRFIYIGKHPALVPDNEDRLIRSYTRGGYAGLEYESNEYYFEGDSLVTCLTLTQKFDRYEADTSYFILTEIARPPCGNINRAVQIRVYRNRADSMVIDTVR